MWKRSSNFWARLKTGNFKVYIRMKTKEWWGRKMRGKSAMQSWYGKIKLKREEHRKIFIQGVSKKNVLTLRITRKTWFMNIERSWKTSSTEESCWQMFKLINKKKMFHLEPTPISLKVVQIDDHHYCPDNADNANQGILVGNPCIFCTFCQVPFTELNSPVFV